MGSLYAEKLFDVKCPALWMAMDQFFGRCGWVKFCESGVWQPVHQRGNTEGIKKRAGKVDLGDCGYLVALMMEHWHWWTLIVLALLFGEAFAPDWCWPLAVCLGWVGQSGHGCLG